MMPLPSQLRLISCLLWFLTYVRSAFPDKQCDDNVFWAATYIHQEFELRCDGSFISWVSSCHCEWARYRDGVYPFGQPLFCFDDVSQENKKYNRRYPKVEDRRWNFQCGFNLTGISDGIWVNNHALQLNQSNVCPENYAITRITSRLYNMKDDDRLSTFKVRSYRAMCSRLPEGYLVNGCITVKSVAHEKLFETPAGNNHVITKMTSSFHRGFNDRSFQMEVCSMCGKPRWGEWSPWGGSCIDDNSVRSRTRECQTEGNICNECPKIREQKQEEPCNPDPLVSLKEGSPGHLPNVQIYLKHVDGGSAEELVYDPELEVVCQNNTVLEGPFQWCKNDVCDNLWFKSSDREIKTVGGHTFDTLTLKWHSNDTYSCQYNLLNDGGGQVSIQIPDSGKDPVYLPEILRTAVTQEQSDRFYLPPFLTEVPINIAGEAGKEFKFHISFVQNDEQNLFLFRNYDTEGLAETVDNYIGGGFNVNHATFQNMHVPTPVMEKQMQFTTQPNVNLNSPTQALRSMTKVPSKYIQYKNSMVVHIKGQSEVALALEEHDYKFYLFLIGRDNNHGCSLHFGTVNLEQKRIITTSGCELSPTTYRSFWLSWDINGNVRHLQLGDGNEVGKNLLISYEHTDYFRFDQIRIGTLDRPQSSTSYWIVFPEIIEMTTPDIYSNNELSTFSDTKFDVSRQDHLVFSLESKEDQHVFLWDGESKWYNGYRVMIGIMGNTVCGVRLTLDLQDPVHSQTDCPKVLSATSFRDFWISWTIVDGDRVIRLGEGANVGEDIILTYTNTPLFEVRKVLVGSNGGTRGFWEIPMISVGLPHSISAQGYQTRITAAEHSYKKLEVVIPKLTAAHAGLYALMESRYNYLLNPTRTLMPRFTAAFEVNVLHSLRCLSVLGHGNGTIELVCEAVFTGGLPVKLIWFMDDVEIPRTEYSLYIEEDGATVAFILARRGVRERRYTCTANFEKPDASTSRLANVGNAFLKTYNAPIFSKNCLVTVKRRRQVMPNDTGTSEGGAVKLEAIVDLLEGNWRHGNKTYGSNIKSGEIQTSANALQDGNTFFTLQIHDVKKEHGGTWSFESIAPGEEKVLGSAEVAVMTKLMCYQQSYRQDNMKDRRSVVCQAEQNAEVERYLSWQVVDKDMGTIDIGSRPNSQHYHPVTGYQTWKDGTSTTGKLEFMYNREASVGNIYICQFHFQNAFHVDAFDEGNVLYPTSFDNSSDSVQHYVASCNVTIEDDDAPVVVKSPGNPVGMLNQDMQLTWRVALNNLHTLYIDDLQTTSNSLVDGKANSCSPQGSVASTTGGAICEELPDSTIQIRLNVSMDPAVLGDSPKVVLRGTTDEAGGDDLSHVSWILVFDKFECSVVNRNVEDSDTFVCKSWYFGKLQGEVVWTNGRGEVIRAIRKENAKNSDISDPNINQVTVPAWDTDTYTCTFRFAPLSKQVLDKLSKEYTEVSEAAPEFQRTCNQFVDGLSDNKAPRVLKSPRNVAGVKQGNVSVSLSYQKGIETGVQLIGGDGQVVWSSAEPPSVSNGNYVAQQNDASNDEKDVEMLIRLDNPAVAGFHQFLGVRYPQMEDGKGISKVFEVSILDSIQCGKSVQGSRSMFELRCTATSYGNLDTSLYWKRRESGEMLDGATMTVNNLVRGHQRRSAQIEVKLEEDEENQMYECVVEFVPRDDSTLVGWTNIADNKPEFSQSCTVVISRGDACLEYVEPSQREECPGAYEGITRQECEGLNCCFDSTSGDAGPVCYMVQTQTASDQGSSNLHSTDDFEPLRSLALSASSAVSAVCVCAILAFFLSEK